MRITSQKKFTYLGSKSVMARSNHYRNNLKSQTAFARRLRMHLSTSYLPSNPIIITVLVSGISQVKVQAKVNPPAEDNAPTENGVHTEDSVPAAGNSPIEDTASVNGNAPAEGSAPAIGNAPIEDDAPSGDIAPVGDNTPVDGDAPADGNAEFMTHLHSFLSLRDLNISMPHRKLLFLSLIIVTLMGIVIQLVLEMEVPRSSSGLMRPGSSWAQHHYEGWEYHRGG